VKVAQSATAPKEPVFPPKPLFIALGAVIGLVGGAAACVMLEAISARRRHAYDRRRHISDDERSRKWEPADEGEWQQPAPDRRFKDRTEPAPNDWAPAHEVAEYRGHR